MKRVLIISTRYTLIQRVKQILQHFPDRYLLCGTADNSVLGMSLIESMEPDIVIMPVQMSFWDAEALINNLLLKGNCPTFLLLENGHYEFSPSAVVKIASVLSEKDFTNEAMLQALETASTQKQAENDFSQNRFQQSSVVQHSLEVMELIMGLSPLQTQAAQQEYGRLRVGRRDCWLLLGGIHPQYSEEFDFLSDLNRLEDVFQALVNTLRPLGVCEVCVYQERNICILLEEGQTEEPEWRHWIERINLQLEGLNMPKMFFEVSDTPLPLDRWHRQCRELVKLREMRFFYSPLFLRPSSREEYKKFVPQTQLHDQLSALAQALQSGRLSQINDVLENLKELVCRSLSREVYSYVVSQMVLLYHNLRYSLGLESGEGAYTFRMQQYKSVNAFFVSYSTAVEHLLGQINQSISSNPLIVEICQYIHRNISDELTLERLSQHVHVTPSYLSRLFKKETKESLNAYINQQRVQKAKTLLRSDWRITDISGMVGFDSAKYFSQVFKKLTGKTPQEYRQEL